MTRDYIRLNAWWYVLFSIIGLELGLYLVSGWLVAK